MPLETITPLPTTPSPSETVAVNLATQTPVESLATATPSPTPAGPCRDNAHFVVDITVPDGTQFLPGAPIDKQWRVRNTGTCDWGPDYRLLLVSGNALGAVSEAALYPAKAGNEAIIELTMVAPQAPGQYTGRWQARSPSARLFGDRVFITINVVISPTVTVTATATP